MPEMFRIIKPLGDGMMRNISGMVYDKFGSKKVKADINPKYDGMLDEAVKVLMRNPDLKIEIQGHTDSIGSAAYNMGLSERRAKAVMRYFMKEGVNVSRLKAVGYGLTRPLATNKTKEGRAQNRRVELAPIFW